MRCGEAGQGVKGQAGAQCIVSRLWGGCLVPSSRPRGPPLVSYQPWLGGRSVLASHPCCLLHLGAVACLGALPCPLLTCPARRPPPGRQVRNRGLDVRSDNVLFSVSSQECTMHTGAATNPGLGKAWGSCSRNGCAAAAGLPAVPCTWPAPPPTCVCPTPPFGKTLPLRSPLSLCHSVDTPPHPAPPLTLPPLPPDSTNRFVHPDVVALLCVRPASGSGGESLLCNAVNAYYNLRARLPAFLMCAALRRRRRHTNTASRAGAGGFLGGTASRSARGWPAWLPGCLAAHKRH